MPNPADEPRVSRITFNETLQVEIRFVDGREVVWTGQPAADLRAVVQSFVRRGFDQRKRGMSGPNSVSN